jgi:hypothetical protein
LVIGWSCDINDFAEPTINEFPSDTEITEGEGVYFRIKVSGEPQPTVTWYHDGEPVRADYAREIESDGSLTIPSTELKHSGVYKAVAANTHGSEEREIKLLVDTAGDDIVFSRPIPIPEFGKYVVELHANSNIHFKDLFQVCASIINKFIVINMCLHRLWILVRKVIVLNTPPTEKGNHSTDLEILLCVSEFICVTINIAKVILIVAFCLQMMTIALF